MKLLRFEIEDYALIAQASLAFADGFTACTGETGSGKTMLLGALGFALGERATAESIRAGARRARVTLEVEIDAALQARLVAAGLDDDAESVVLSREVAAGGKSTARINGRIVTSAQLREFGALIVESVGQHEQQRLLSHAYQRDVLDAYAGPAALALRERVRAAYDDTRAVEKELAALAESAGRALAELEFARFARAEIEAAAPAAGEDDVLRERRAYLGNVEKIASALGRAHEALAQSDGSASETLGAAAASLASVARYAPSLATLGTSLEALQSEVTETAVAVARELERAEFDPAESETVAARLDTLERLKQKYGGSIEAVLASGKRFADAVERETTRDEREADLHARLDASRAALARDAAALTRERAHAARLLEAGVALELAALAMPAARFEAVLVTGAELGPHGAESVEYVLSANAGEPLRPLARAASGGELSRVLLALVVTLAGRRERTALVFDEIDAGIGGATATAVGVRLGALARHAQVLCVTHLAQIATWADVHYALRKIERGGHTHIDVVPLDARASLGEIARMLSGSSVGVALEHAETLVRDVALQKSR